MERFNFNLYEGSIINAMCVNYKMQFDIDGGFSYYQLRTLLRMSLEERLERALKKECLDNTIEEAMSIVDKMVEDSNK